MDLLAMYAASQPDKPAVIDDRPGRPVVSWSFADLNRRANQLANYLAGIGAGPGTKVVWCGQNSASLVAATHALRKLGAVGVPLNYRLMPEEAAYVVDNCDAQFVYVDAEYAELMDAIRADVPKVSDILIFDGDGELERLVEKCPAEPPALDDSQETAAATMIYTSGTTGKPKGAVRRPVNDSRHGGELMRMIGYQPDDVYLTTGPLYHSGPGGFAALAHLLGNTVVVQHKFDPEDWLRLVQTYSVTTTFSAPTPIRMVCSLPPEVKQRYDRSTMKRMLANAAPWPLALKKMYLADFPPDSLWEIYGSTELGVDTVLAPDDHLRKPGSCGKPAPGIEIKLFDEEGKEVTEPHQVGELYVCSDTVFDTYYKAEDKYRESSRDDFHTVGDMAYFDEEGYYYIADRKHDMIISGGVNIYPAEIEAALEAMPGIYEAAVFGIPNDEWGESVHAVVVANRSNLTVEEVQAYAREHLAGYKVPRSVSFAEELPKTGSGKILKRELRAPYWAETGRQV